MTKDDAKEELNKMELECSKCRARLCFLCNRSKIKKGLKKIIKKDD